MDKTPAEFVFATCQVGAEAALKRELARVQPDWRFSYSRPGFLTFKVPDQFEPDFRLRSAFARSYGLSLGKADGNSVAERAISVWRLAENYTIDRLHVWSRDRQPVTTVLPEDDESANEAKGAILQAAPESIAAPPLTESTDRGDLVLDCVLVEPAQWWIGVHAAKSVAERWIGGIWPGHPPDEIISRAYMKMSEAMDWAGWPIKPGQRCVEIGCAPGGASQALLGRGLRVTGIDPAEVDPRLLNRPDFRHLRKRGGDLKRREFAEYQWLVADMIVTPPETLATVGDIVTYRGNNIRGFILNLKLPDWSLADDLPDYLETVRGWGYRSIRARQLSHNRQEVCVTAVKPLSRRRKSRHESRHRAPARLADKLPTGD